MRGSLVLAGTVPLGQLGTALCPRRPRDLGISGGPRGQWGGGRVGARGRTPSSPWGGPAGAQGPAPHPPTQSTPGSGQLPPEDPTVSTAWLLLCRAEDGAASMSTAGTTAWTASRPPRQGRGADGDASLPGRCVPCHPHHSPSRAPSKDASEPGASEVLSKQIVAFRENHEFRAFVFPAEENGKEPVLSKRPDSQGSPVPAREGAPRGAEWTRRQRRQRPRAPSQAVGQAEHPGSWPARPSPARLWSVPASLRCQPAVPACGFDTTLPTS